MTTPLIQDILNGKIKQDCCLDISITQDLIEDIKATENEKDVHNKINNYLKFLMNSFEADDAIAGGKNLFQSITTHINPSEIECFSEYFDRYKDKVLGNNV